MLNREPQRYKQSVQFSRLVTRKPQCKVKKSMPHEFVKTAAQSFPTLMLYNYCRLTRLRISRLMWESCLPCPCELRYCPLLGRCVTLACRFSWTEMQQHRGFIRNLQHVVRNPYVRLVLRSGTTLSDWRLGLQSNKQPWVIQECNRYNCSSWRRLWRK